MSYKTNFYGWVNDFIINDPNFSSGTYTSERAWKDRYSSGSKSYDNESKRKSTFIFEQDGVEVHFMKNTYHFKRKFFNSPTLDKKFSQANFCRIAEECKLKESFNGEKVYMTFDEYERQFKLIHKNRLYLQKFSKNQKKSSGSILNRKYW